MIEVYSKMTPDAFRSQLQTALTAYYEDIKGIVCASGYTKSKVVKRKFEDQEDTVADAAKTADADATPEGEEAAEGAMAHPAGRSLHRPPALRERTGPSRQGRHGGVVGRLVGPKADAD